MSRPATATSKNPSHSHRQLPPPPRSDWAVGLNPPSSQYPAPPTPLSSANPASIQRAPSNNPSRRPPPPRSHPDWAVGSKRLSPAPPDPVSSANPASLQGPFPKNPSQLPPKLAWARGSLQQNSAATTPRSQSPAPPNPVSSENSAWRNEALPRSLSTLEQTNSVRSSRNAVKQAVPPVEGVPYFGSDAVQNRGSDSANPAVTRRPIPIVVPLPSSTQPKAPPTSMQRHALDADNNIAMLLQGLQGFIPPSVVTPPPEVATRASRSSASPSQPGQGQLYQRPFTPGPPRQGQIGNPSATRSPVYSFPIVNGQSNGVSVSDRPQAVPGGPSAGPAPTTLPRMTPYPPPGEPSGLSPPPVWIDYDHSQFVPGVPPDQFYQQQWPGQLLQPQDQPPPPHHSPSLAPPSTGLPMSPRNPPPLRQVPGIPTQSHAILHAPHPSALPPVTSPPPPSSASNRSTSLSAKAGAFVPAKISIKNPSGQKVDILDGLKRPPPLTVPSTSPSSAFVKQSIKWKPVRIESKEQKEKRLAEERTKAGEVEEKSNLSEALIRVNEETARREMGEQGPRKAQEQRRMEEEAERAEKELKEAEEREAREKEERDKELVRSVKQTLAQRGLQKKVEIERAEQQRLRQLREEQGASVEEAERQRRAKGDAGEAPEDVHTFVDEEPTFLRGGEVEDEVSQPAADKTKKLASVNMARPTSPEPFPVPLPSGSRIPVELPLEKQPLLIDTSVPSPEHPWKRPRGRGRTRGRGGVTLIQRLEHAARSAASEYDGDDDDLGAVTSTPPQVPSLPVFFGGGTEADDEPEPDYHDDDTAPVDLPVSNRDSLDGLDSAFANVLRRSSSSGSLPYDRTTTNTNISPLLPSPVATSRHIEDITYPQGIKSPKGELNVNTQEGKSLYDRELLSQFMNVYKENTDNPPPLDVVGLEPSDASHTIIPAQPLVGSSKGASTPFVPPVPEPALSAEVAPVPRSDIVPASIPESHSTAPEIHPESIQVYPASYVSTPPDFPSRAETEHAANAAPPIQQSDIIRQHGQDESQLSIKMSSQPDEAFVAPMMFPPLKYTLNHTRKKLKPACPNPVLNNHAILPPKGVEAAPVLVMVDNASNPDTTIPQNDTEPPQEAVVALPSSSGARRDQSANPFESKQSALTAYPGDRTITSISESTSIGFSFSNASPIDDPIPPTSEVGSAMPVRKSSSGDSAAGDSNKYKYLTGEFFGYDTGTDEWPVVPQRHIFYLEGTPDHGQTRPAESGAILASQYDDHMGLVSVHRFASVGWQEYLLLDGKRYFSNAALHVVTDVDLRHAKGLDAVMRFLDGPDTEIFPPPQWELWLRDGNETRREFIPVKAWVHHGARMVVSKHPESDLARHVNEGIDEMDSEFEYWQYVVSHPVHAFLPPATIAEAVEVLMCIYNSWLAPSLHHSQPPFSQDECQELLTQLRSFSHTSAQTKSLARTSVVSTVFVRVVAWRQGRHWDCGTFQDSRQSNNDPSDGASHTRTGGEFSISSFGSGLPNASWNDRIIKVSAREVVCVVLLLFCWHLLA